MEYSFGIPLNKPVDQTDKEAEYYRDMVVSQGEHIELLKQNVNELQGQLQQAYRRIAELREALDVEVQENRKDEEMELISEPRIIFNDWSTVVNEWKWDSSS